MIIASQISSRIKPSTTWAHLSQTEKMLLPILHENVHQRSNYSQFYDPASRADESSPQEKAD